MEKDRVRTEQLEHIVYPIRMRYVSPQSLLQLLDN